MRGSYVRDEHHIVMPLSKEEKRQIRENGKRKYQQARQTAGIKKEEYIDTSASTSGRIEMRPIPTSSESQPKLPRSTMTQR